MRRRVGSTSGPAQCPGGERSPWKERAIDAGNGAGRNGPDSGVKPRGRGSPRSAGNGHARRSNDEGRKQRQSATATWRGCWRGDFFEGCEGADGKAPDAPDQTVFGPLERPSGARNAANPFRYRDATSPGPRARRKPSRWCETTRAERVGWCGNQAADGGGNVTRSGRERGTSEEGHTMR
jgi:hypothetical protein